MMQDLELGGYAPRTVRRFDPWSPGRVADAAEWGVIAARGGGWWAGASKTRGGPDARRLARSARQRLPRVRMSKISAGAGPCPLLGSSEPAGSETGHVHLLGGEQRHVQPVHERAPGRSAALVGALRDATEEGEQVVGDAAQ